MEVTVATDFFLRNSILNAALAAWFCAQVLKVIISLICGKFEKSRFVGTGGMPSAHTATVISLVAAIYRAYGYQTPEFAISLAVALIVIYDAMGIRRAAGRHAKMINDMEVSENKLNELLGHTPLEVLAGAVLGILIGFFVVAL